MDETYVGARRIGGEATQACPFWVGIDVDAAHRPFIQIFDDNGRTVRLRPEVARALGASLVASAESLLDSHPTILVEPPPAAEPPRKHPKVL